MSAASRTETRGSTRSRYLLLSLLVLALDQWSKWAIQQRLPLHRSLDLIPGLSFTHVENTGVAFGLFASRGELFGTLLLTAFGLAALILVLVYFSRTPLSDRRVLVALALILGGAVGNLLDRVVQGAVTDFIDVYVGTYHWHTFNVADSAITLGICLLALDIFLGRSDNREVGDDRAAAEGS